MDETIQGELVVGYRDEDTQLAKQTVNEIDGIIGSLFSDAAVREILEQSGNSDSESEKDSPHQEHAGGKSDQHQKNTSGVRTCNAKALPPTTIRYKPVKWIKNTAAPLVDEAGRNITLPTLYN